MLNTTADYIHWLNLNINHGEDVPGATWVGNNNGTDGCDWEIYSESALEVHAALVEYYATRDQDD